VYLRRRKEFDLGLVSDLGLKEFRDGRRVDDRKLDVIERPLPIDARRLDTDASTMLPNNGSSHCRSLKGPRERQGMAYKIIPTQGRLSVDQRPQQVENCEMEGLLQSVDGLRRGFAVASFAPVENERASPSTIAPPGFHSLNPPLRDEQTQPRSARRRSEMAPNQDGIHRHGFDPPSLETLSRF
jgi:hypothetical protein